MQVGVRSMHSKWTVTWYAVLLLKCTTCTNISNLAFPDSFLFGAASSAYQVEGAWNESGKSPSIWDYMTHNTSVLSDGSTGDVASDSYHQYKKDIAALKELGVNYYRLSISWPRLLPTGFSNQINPAAVEYYNNLIDGLLAEGIEAWVTMYHWDMPQTIRYLGGWNNAEIVNYIADYADLLFQLFGDRVKTWLTINEPYVVCVTSVNNYDVKQFGQASIPSGVTEYQCGHNILKAHAKIYRLYQHKYKDTQNGRISMAIPSSFPLSATNSDSNIAAANRFNDFLLGWFLHPLVYGGYPQSMIDIIGNNSLLQGYPCSRLPKFTEKEKEEIKGAYDFLGINHYFSNLVVPSNASDTKTASFSSDRAVDAYFDPSWPATAATWLKVHPEGFRALLLYLKENFGNPEIAITEQGYPDEPDTLNDTGRINYFQLYLSQALKSIYEDGVNLTAYTVWSLLDCFEFYGGYAYRFGLYHVDFEDENRTRTAKESVKFYKNLIATRRLV